MRAGWLGAAVGAVVALASAQGARAARVWQWSYRATGIEASGTLTTADQADRKGFYRILSITGERNGVKIVELAPTREPVPGNVPYRVDNRIRTQRPQLTKDGFGYRLDDGDYANAFFLDGGYVEYLSKPPYQDGAGPEGPISFEANQAARRSAQR